MQRYAAVPPRNGRHAVRILSRAGGWQVPVLIDASVTPEPASEHGLGEGVHCADGLVVRDSAAILTYLAVKYDPTHTWLPRDDPVRQARIAQWLAYAGAEINNSLLKVRVSVLFGWDIAPLTLDQALAASRATLAYLDSQLAAGEAACRIWLVSGATPSIADVAVYPYVAYAEDSSKGEISLRDYPAVSAWLARFKYLPGYVAPPGLE